MANNPLRDLCETWTGADGGLELLMLPFTSLRANVLHAEFTKLVPRAEWTFPENTFSIFYIYVIDVVVNSESPILRTFSALWEMRDEPVAERWAFFQQVYNDDLADMMSRAFNETRDHTFDGPKALRKKPVPDAKGNPPDPKASRPTRARSKAS